MGIAAAVCGVALAAVLLPVIRNSLEAKVLEKEYTTLWRGKELAGTLYLPDDGREQREVVILSHGLNATAAYNMPYIEALTSAGVAVYAFDFYGGSHWGKSGGDTTEMTVSGEAEQLSRVIDMVKTWSWVDQERVILLGESQGGLVSALAAAERDDIDTLILIYPAFSLPKMLRERYETLEQVPDTFSFSGMRLGKGYCEDLWELDPYAAAGAFPGPVLLIHGDSDEVIPLESSEKALEAFPDARLEVLEGAGHGFEGEQMREAAGKICEFIRERRLSGVR